ncbi:MAG: methyl-accepting chemotaxis protein [Pseudomonadota bacterium]
MKLRLKGKMLVPLAFLIAVSVIASTWISYSYSRNAITGLSEEQIRDRVGFASVRVDDWIAARINEVEKLVQFEDVQKATKYRGLRKNASDFLVEYVKERTFFEQIAVTDEEGLVVSSNIPDAVDSESVAAQDFFTQAMTEKTQMTKVVKSSRSGHPVFTIAVPVYINKVLSGTVFAVLDVNWISDAYIKPVKVGKTGYAYLLSRDGIVIAHPKEKHILTLDAKKLSFGPRLMESEQGVIRYEFEGVDKIVGFRRVKSTGWVVGAGADVNELLDQAVAMRNILIAVGLATILVLLGGAWLFVQKMVVVPVKRVAGSIKDIAEGEGDLTRRIEVRSVDEIGDLSMWFNNFIKKLEVIIGDVKHNAETVNGSSAELSELSGHMAKGSESMTEKAQGVAAAAEEMSANINSVAAACEQAATNISTVSAATEEINASIGEIARSSEKGRSVTEEAVQKTRSASERMDELGRAASEISKVTEAISEISEQTNLLALNATIEAARAGEAGKGFAVVASEIKALAKQTADATDDIRQRIEAIQGATSATIGEIETVAKVIQNVNDIVSTIAAAVEEQSATSREISENMGQASQGLQEVNGNLAQSSQVAGDIARDIADVSHIAGEISNSSSQVNMSADTMSELSMKLHDLVKGFKVSQ